MGRQHEAQACREEERSLESQEPEAPTELHEHRLTEHLLRAGTVEGLRTQRQRDRAKALPSGACSPGEGQQGVGREILTVLGAGPEAWAWGAWLLYGEDVYNAP